jgi:DNA-binding transcriptional LysR family regulator
MRVELRHLRALAAIGDEGTITAAANVLGISQPALSRTLEQLEQHLRVVLVERTTRSVRLTAAGQRLWEHAHQILTTSRTPWPKQQPVPARCVWASPGPR